MTESLQIICSVDNSPSMYYSLQISVAPASKLPCAANVLCVCLLVCVCGCVCVCVCVCAAPEHSWCVSMLDDVTAFSKQWASGEDSSGRPMATSEEHTSGIQ